MLPKTNKYYSMAKKPFLILIAGLLCLSAFGQKDVIIIDHGTDITKGHPYVIPNVTYDGDDVTIKSDSTITDMTVVIHQSTQTVGPAETTLYVPNTDGDSEKTTIDLYYDRRHLSGTFDE